MAKQIDNQKSLHTRQTNPDYTSKITSNKFTKLSKYEWAKKEHSGRQQ